MGHLTSQSQINVTAINNLLTHISNHAVFGTINWISFNNLLLRIAGKHNIRASTVSFCAEISAVLKYYYINLISLWGCTAVADIAEYISSSFVQ